MESKKINQLATELAPELSDLTIIGDPTTGISKKITLSQMASLFTGTVEEYANLASFPLVGTADTIYIALDTNIIYRWNTGTSAYVELSPNIVTSLVFNDANGFDGTISLVGSTATLTITTALTQGSIGFIGASGALTQDNSNFFWDNTNKRLGINTNAPTTALDAFGSGIIGRLNGTSTNNAFLGFASAGSNKWSIGNVQSDHRFRIYSEANAAELVSVLQTGEVGIGIANPLTKLHIFGGASALIANLDANTSVAKSISFRSGNSSRINLEVSGTESGSNAGMNFYLRAYTDAGALLSTPLTIIRSTGAATFSSTVTASNGTLIGGAGTTNYIPKFNASNAIENSVISQNGTYIGINIATPKEKLEIEGLFGNIRIYGRAGVSNNVISSNLYYDGTNWLHDNTSYGAAQIVLSSQSGAIIFGTTTATTGDATEKMRLLGSGNLGINTATAGAGLPSGTGWTSQPTKVRVLQINSTDGNANAGVFIRQTDESTGLDLWSDNYFGDSYIDSRWNNSSGKMYFRLRTAGTSVTPLTLTATGNAGFGTNTPVEYSGYRSLHINAATSTGSAILYLTNSTSSVRGLVFAEGTLSRITFGSQSNHDVTFVTNDTERMRIFANGTVMIGTSNTSGQALWINTTSGGGTGQGGMSLQGDNMDTGHANGTASGSFYHRYIYNGQVIGSITQNGTTSVAYNTSSDYRLKEDFKNINGIEKISAIKVYDFKWVGTNERMDGVIAHELSEILPYAVSGKKDAKDSDGNIIPQGVDYSKIVPILVKAIQEQQKEIELLKSK